MSSTGTQDAAAPLEEKEAKTSVKGTKSVHDQVVPKHPKLKRSKNQGMMHFARGACTDRMTYRELVHCLEEMKLNKGSCVCSPYDVIPCVPLCPETRTKLFGQPHISRQVQKNIYKETSDLDMQMKTRGRTHCDIRVGIYIPGCKRRLNPFTIDLMLPNKKLKNLNMNDHDLVRDEVALGKKRFLEKVSRRKMSSMLHFWDTIKAGQIEKETRNPRFCNIFSTYSWSWDAQCELLAKEKLWQWETKKHWETVSAPLHTGIHWNYMAQQEETDGEHTEDLNDSSWNLSESPNAEQKPEKEDIVHERNDQPSAYPLLQFNK
ncbi:EF-hand calcium-binding domain-containing protein 3 isoform X2 [Eleutherodactylus coqui]|uniref:Uncharacterized protein n=1 Tax=Eleutherodactylus coqui TaxID=57060 RepID=A0A8J6ET77_ELECQ|nr:hypothetical protein GDO78_004601 [Eleutherodactylus coqui]